MPEPVDLGGERGDDVCERQDRMVVRDQNRVDRDMVRRISVERADLAKRLIETLGDGLANVITRLRHDADAIRQNELAQGSRPAGEGPRDARAR